MNKKYAIYGIGAVILGIGGLIVYTSISRKKLYKDLMDNLETVGTGKEVPVTESEALNPNYYKKFNDVAKYHLATLAVNQKNAKYFHKLLVDDTFIASASVVKQIKAMTSKAILSQVAEQYEKLYKSSLADALKHVGWFSNSDVTSAIASLPNVAKLGKK